MLNEDQLLAQARRMYHLYAVCSLNIGIRAEELMGSVERQWKLHLDRDIGKQNKEHHSSQLKFFHIAKVRMQTPAG